MSVSNFMEQYIICCQAHYVIKQGGMVLMTDDPGKATGYDTREEASNQRPGHDRAMGGSGQKGYTIRRDLALHEFRNNQYRNY